MKPIAIRTDARGRQLPPWEQPELRAAMGYSAAARAAVKMRARMGYSPADLAAAAKITGEPDPRRVVRGRAYDRGDGYANCAACHGQGKRFVP